MKTNALLSVLTALVAVSAFALNPNNSWQKVDGDASGAWSSDGHWSVTHVPTAGERANLPGGLGDYTLTFGTGVDAKSSFQANVASGETVVLDGRNSFFTQSAQTEACYDQEMFSIRALGSHFVNLQNYTGSYQTDSVQTMTNFYMRLSAPDGHPRLDFDQGDYNFHNPLGAAAGAKVMMLFVDGVGQFGTPSTRNSSIYFHEGTSTTLGQLYIQGNSEDNVLCFDGGTHKLATTVYLPQASQAMTDKATDTHVWIKDTAVVDSASTFIIGSSGNYYGNTANRHFDISVFDGGTFRISAGEVKQENLGVLDVSVTNGATLTVNGVLSLAKTAGPTGNLWVVDSAVNVVGASARLNLGDTANETASKGGYGSIQARNAVFTLSNGGKINCCHGQSLVRDSIVNFTGTESAINTRWLGEIAFSNTTFNVDGPMTVGDYQATDSKVLFADCCFNLTNTINLNASNVTFDDCALDGTAGKSMIIGGIDKRYPVVTFRGDKTTNTIYGSLYCGNFAGNDTTANFEAGRHTFGGSIYVCATSGSATMNISGADVINLVNPAHVKDGWSAFMYVGQKGAGALNVSSGSFYTADNAGINIGYEGSGDMTVSGGTVTAKRILMGNNANVPEQPDRLTVTGGLLDITSIADNYGIRAAMQSGRTSYVTLDGGVVRCGRFSGEAGTSYFSANGGRIEVPSATTVLMSGFTSAKLGEKGLTLDSDFAVTVAQSFTGDGRLILTGTGAKTLTGSASSIGTLEVSEGLVTLPSSVVKLGSVAVSQGATVDFNGCATEGVVTSLTLGDAESAGVLKLRAGQPIVVGDLEVVHAVFDLEGEFPSGDEGTDYTVLTVTGAMSDATKVAVAKAYARRGLAAGDAATCTVVTDEKGGHVVMHVGKARNLLIRLDEGVSNATENVTYSGNEMLTAEVADGAALTLSGAYGTGSLARRGSGKCYLTGSENAFLTGVTLYGGLLSVADPACLGLWPAGATAGLTLTNGTLEVTGPQTGASFDRPFVLASAPISTLYAGSIYKGHDGVIVKNDVDLEMPVPQPANAAFFKRGAGRMTLTSEKTAAFPATYGHDVFGYTPAWGEYVFDDEGTVPTDRVYAALSVVEGDLTLKGLGETPVEFDYGGSLMIGVPTKSCTVNPSLTLDNAQYLNKGGGTRLYLGPMMAESISSVTEASLVLTNGSRMTIDTMSIHYNTSTGGRKTRVVVDGSDLVVTYAMENGISATAPDDCLTFRNGSRLLIGGGSSSAPGLKPNNVATYDFDGSVFAKNDALDPALITFVNRTTTSTFAFRNGSEFRCDRMTCTSPVTADQYFVFDGSKWIPGADDFTFDFPSVPAAKVVTEGEGLVLEPPVNKTWTFNLPVTGEGGLVVGGEGTVVLDGAKWSATGAARVRAGATLDLGGTVSAGLLVGGEGTVRNGTAGGIALRVDEDYRTKEVPALDGVSFAGRARVDLGRTDEDPLVEPFRTITVCTYEGTAPDVSGWRLKGTGLRNIRGAFKAADGVVTVLPEHSGLLLIVR